MKIITILASLALALIATGCAGPHSEPPMPMDDPNYNPNTGGPWRVDPGQSWLPYYSSVKLIHKT
jgi:hypothetical protein